MNEKYIYWFPPGTETPERLWKETTKTPTGWSEIQLSPSRSDEEWRGKTLWFWDWLRKTGVSYQTHAVVEYYPEGMSFKKREYNQAELFAIDTFSFLGQELAPPARRGCRFCGNGRVLRNNPVIDERTAIFWRFGFTSTGRFVVHIQVYEEMLLAGLTGYTASPIRCMKPDEYIIILWRGSLEKVKKDFEAFPGHMPEGIHIEEWGENLILTAAAPLVDGPEFEELNRYLTELDEQEVLDYRLIPPASRVGDIKARWVGIDVTGVVGTELGVNDYKEEIRCPECGMGALCPRGQLRVDASTADGADIGVTETGRICLSKKACKIFCKPDGFMVESVVCV